MTQPSRSMPLRSALTALCAALCFSSAHADLRVVVPRCEYAASPMGIDVAAPRLGWQLESDQRGVRQAAYRVRVASSTELLAKGTGDLWDSGEVKSDQSTQVEYAGKPLASRQHAYWRVDVWDTSGQTAASEVATWEMGLLAPGDRTAKWIQYEPRTPDVSSLEKASWIWFPEADPAKPEEHAQRYFRKVFELPQGDAVSTAVMTLSADDQYQLFVNGTELGSSSGGRDSWRRARSFDLSGVLKPGSNCISIRCSNELHNAGLVASATVHLASGKIASVTTDSAWESGKSATREWMDADKEVRGWAKAAVIAPYGQGAWGKIEGELPLGMCPHLRTSFTLDKEIKSARLYASALGLYEFRINGQKVGGGVFTPGWTDYTKRVQYQTYDVTSLMAKGKNALGLIIADGWYAGHVGLGGPHRYAAIACAWGQLEVEFRDGTRATYGTDGSWKASRGPIQMSDLLMGEEYDARKELAGWDTPAYDDSRWQPAQVAGVTPTMVATSDGQVRKIMQLPAKAVTEPKPGTFVYDLGQNMVGWARLKVKGPAGTTVTMRFAEILNPDGTIYTTNLRSARCIDRYTLKGDGEELYEPRFTFHGFRYVELTGFPGTPDFTAVTGIVAHSDTPQTGGFECSDPRINQLQSNIVWGQRGNFVSVPTDCPQRDERLGWMGDAQIFVRTATFNMDVSRFFTKWCRDVEDAQRPDGAFTDVSPFVAAGAGTAAWGDAGVICPWTIYRVYGDTRILKEHYASAQRWIDYLEKHSTNLLRPAQGYGDWIAIGADTPKDVLATAYFAESTRIVAAWAGVIGKQEDAQRYRDLWEKIRAAFNTAYVSADGTIKGNTQTCYVLALSFDLLPQELRPIAADHLAADIKAKDNHLSTGFVGVGHLTPTLTAVGKTDLAYTLLMQDTFPGWLYSVKNGATTIWERWDGWTKEKGFQDPGMNSFNHYSLGSVGEWMYSTVLGIDLDPSTPGFKHAIIHPRPGGGLTWAKGHFDSLYGRFISAWKLENGAFSLDVTIPPNTTATIVLPDGTATEGGTQLDKVPGLRLEKRADGMYVQAGSGTYAFSVK